MSIARHGVYVLLCTGVLAACSSSNPPTINPEHGISAAIKTANASTTYSTPQYKAIRLPSGFLPSAIMKDGQIPGTIDFEAAIYRNGKLMVLGRYKGARTVLYGVNSSGVAVGSASARTNGPNAGWARAVQYKNGTFSPFPYVPHCLYGEAAQTINDNGDIYGTCWQLGQNGAPFIARYAPGTPSRITGPDDGRGDLFNVNASGTFVEWAYFDAADDGAESVEGTGTAATAILPRVKYPTSGATGINDAGTIVGWLSTSTTLPPTPQNAYVYPIGGPLKVLPLLPGATTMTPTGVNANGTVVGNWDSGIFLYKSGVLYDITNSITPTGSNSALPGLSDSGRFVAGGNGPDYPYYLVEPLAP